MNLKYWSFRLAMMTIMPCILLFSCQEQASRRTAFERVFATTAGLILKDTLGNPLILHGLNLVNKDRSTGYWGGMGKPIFDSIGNWGMNCIRLGISWDALAPAPGKIDTAYLLRIDSCIQWAREAGLYVVMDMHQDLYSHQYDGNGAPAWACIDDGKPSAGPSAVWDDAYFTNAALQTAFDNFWKNRAVPGGEGVQDHLAAAWKAVAARYAHEPVVLGYDLMNEPFIGSGIIQVQQSYFQTLFAVAQKQDGLNVSNMDQLFAKWSKPEGRLQIMQLLNDTMLYKQLMDSTEHIYADFERTGLQPFYEKVVAAIQTVDTNHLFFLEPSVSANSGVRSHLENFLPGKIVYTPHAYDLVTDTRNVDAFSKDRMRIIMRRHQETQLRLQVPMTIGEWGAFYGEDSIVIPQATYIMEEINRLQCGNIYWSYQPDLDKRAYFSVLQKVDKHKAGK